MLTRQQQRHATRQRHKDTASMYRKSAMHRGDQFRTASWRDIERLLEIGPGDAVSGHGD